MLAEYMSKKANYYFGNMAKDFQGFDFKTLIDYNLLFILGLEKTSDLNDKIAKLSATYWDYKGYYNFSSDYKGSFVYGLTLRLTF